MKRLFVIGNGFDKDHGIESDYKDFETYLQENQYLFYTNIVAAFESNGYLWDDFESFLPECALYIEQSGLQMGEEMIEEIDYDPCNDMGIGFWLHDQYDFIKDLPEVLHKWVEQIDINKEEKYAFNSDDQFLTFNYTNTLEKIYGMKKVLHIHGNVSNPIDVLIIGHGDR